MNKKALVTITLLAATVAGIVLAQGAAPATISSCDLQHDFSTWASLRCPFVPSGGSTNCDFVTDTTQDCAVCCTLDTVYTVTDWIFYIVVSFAIILVVLGAYKIMTAGGAPDNVTTGRNYIMWAMVGLGVALLAKSIPAIVKSLLRLG